MSEDDLKQLLSQNETIIALLGHIAFKDDEIRKILTKKKQNPERYIQGYNACDGEHTVTQIAAIVGVKHPTIVPILQEWEELGIVREVEKTGGKFYKKLFPIKVET
jgi:Fic family protein